MNRGVKIQWVGEGQNPIGRGIKIHWYGSQNTMDKGGQYAMDGGFDIPWAGGSKYHGWWVRYTIWIGG